MLVLLISIGILSSFQQSLFPVNGGRPPQYFTVEVPGPPVWKTIMAPRRETHVERASLRQQVDWGMHLSPHSFCLSLRALRPPPGLPEVALLILLGCGAKNCSILWLRSATFSFRDGLPGLLPVFCYAGNC